MSVLILGFGNLLAGDDGVGFRAAQMLAARVQQPQVCVRALRQLTPELAEDAAQADVVVFVDASVELPPGKIGCRRIEATATASVFSHQLAPEAVLGLAERLYGRRPEALLFSVGARTFTGPELSSEVRQALPSLLGQIEELIGRILKAGEPACPADPAEAEGDFFSLMH